MEFVKKHYKKELLSSKLYIKATGAPAPFEDIGGDEGILATDNPVYVTELDQAAARHIGGVIPIDEATFNELKKKAAERPSLASLVRDRQSLSGLNLPLPANLGGLAAAVNPAPLHGQLPDTPKAEPIAIPTTFTRPKTSKGFMKKADE
jgi:hypothetical protein